MTPRQHTPSLGAGIGAALAFSVCGAATFAALSPWLGADSALRVAIALLALGYSLYAMAASRERVGRVTTIACLGCASLGAWLFDLPLPQFVLVNVGLVWLVRSLYHYAGLVPALVDLGVALLGLVFAAWAVQRGGGAWLALWCFFLTQAFHVLIPPRLAHRGATAPSPDDAFTRARRAAEAALSRLSSPDHS